VARFAYGLLWWVATPWLLLHLFLRGRRQPAYRSFIGERFGIYAPRHDARPLLWIHAVSVGETHAAVPLISALRLRYPQLRVLLTHMTPTGRAVQVPDNDAVERVYLPYDYPFAVRRFLTAFKPAVGIFMETEVWPNLVAACSVRCIPMALVNGRLSERSARRGMRVRRLIAAALNRLSVILVQSAADAARIKTLGGPKAMAVGNLKFDLAVPAEQIDLAAGLKRFWRNRKVVLCASTREGEEALILDAWLAAAVTPDMLLLIVPRHPQRFDEVERAVTQRGMKLERRSQNVPIDDHCQVVLGDSMGEMFAYYASSDVAYVGGGILPYGTHNLIEACAVGCPVLLGPHTFNFSEAAKNARAAGAAIQVADAVELVAVAIDLLGDSERREAMGARGLAFADAHRGATQKSVAALAPLFVSVEAAR
jgi:3-deoxy-D-manno-octulosonic-acid transferase